MKEKRQSIGIWKDRKAVILNVPFEKENLLVGVTEGGIPIYLINSNDKHILPKHTGLAGQIFTYMFLNNNEVIYAEEICYKDALRELAKDIGCRIEKFLGTGEEFVEQEWRFAKVC